MLPALLARALAWVALAAAIVSCVSGPANRIIEGNEGAPGVHRILVLPPNLVLALRPEIQSGSHPVDREVVAYLESQGREIGRIGLIEARNHWKQAIADAKQQGSPTGASAIFVNRLAERHPFDAVVMPSLILHQTQADFGEASWDGVRRRMKVVGAPAKGIGRDDSTLVKGIAYGGFTGPAWVTSLHVLVYMRDGRLVFEGRGGIDFAMEVDLSKATANYTWEPRTNSSLFRDRALLHEAVVLAFQPYLVPPDE